MHLFFKTIDKAQIAARAVLGVALVLVALPVAAAGLPPLSQDKFVNDSLRAAAIGDTIRRACPSISARIFVALRKVKELERYALNKGYTKEQIDAFIGSREDRKRLEAEARAYMKEHGVIEGRKGTYCKLGREEIGRKSLIGQLLWSWR